MERDIAQAKKNPSSQFQTPQQILDVDRASCSDSDKIAILQQWETDTRELLVAEEENMPPPENSTNDAAATTDYGELLRDIRKALSALGVNSEEGDGAPTKQG